MANRTFDDMDRLFDRMLSDVRERLSAEYPMGGVGDLGLHGRWHEDGDDQVLVLDVPGFEKGDFDVHVAGSVLTIAATHEVEGASEWSTRRIHERVTLPGDVAADHVAASYRNGVLEIRFPRGDHTGTRIDVQ